MLRLKLLLVLLYLLFSILFVESQNFSFPSFDVESCRNLTCWGSVTATNGTLDLTPYKPHNNSNKVARVLFSNSIPIWPASFSTIFTIRISSPQSISGDGMAFLIAQDYKPSPPDSYGSFIGILDPSGGTLHQLAVEFDTYRNEREMDGNHVAIVTTDMENPVAVKSLTDVGIDLRSGRDIAIKIDYDGWTKVLEVSVAYVGQQPLMNILRQEIIMQETVPRNAYVGFSASTAYFSEVHQLVNWNFTLFELPEGSLKYGRDMDKENVTLLVAIPIVVVSLAVVVSFLVIARQHRQERLRRKEDIEMLTRTAANVPRIFTYRKLSKATKSFSKDNLLGTGGFGSVYKGVFYDSPTTTVAVKRINATSNQGEKEYLAEICTIGRLRHKNLVQLLGWCHDREKLLLVYEYMPNGSLDKYIGKIFLDWDTRFKILSGLASSLVYLHEECGNPIVHRDVKPNNVMLDSEYNAHLGDFGLARLLENDNFVTTMVAGTPGYLAPEVSYTGRATPESDVYSFGMVVLEVVCGRRSKGIMDENSLVDDVWSSYEKGALLECMDHSLVDDGEFDHVQAERCLITGLACLHPNRMLRPKMRKVVQLLMSPEEPLMKLPVSRPSFVCVSLHSSRLTTSYDPALGSMKHMPDEVTVSFEYASETKKYTS